VVDLKAVARYKKLTLTSQDTCFAWTVDEAAGTVDSNGLFTAADKTGSGSLTVSAGGCSMTIPIRSPACAAAGDFENENLNSLVGTGTVDVSPSPTPRCEAGQSAAKSSAITPKRPALPPPRLS
jgi:hypothetical protein